MINKFVAKNFGPLEQIKWEGLSKINLIIGGNASGKTFLLKAMYCATKTLEEYKRGNEQRTASEILADKLYWTFQVDKIGDIVTKGAEAPLSSDIGFDNADFIYSFGKDTTKQILSIENHVTPIISNSIFLPAKEILSIHNIILKSRDQDKSFGFDDTYYDLAKALSVAPQKGRNHQEFSSSRKDLEDILGGKVEYDEAAKRWQFKKGNQKFPIGVTSEGVKKISILDTLLVNRYLDRNSIVFIDELESALHPQSISKFIDIVYKLSEAGIQFVIASHSYFVVKKLYLIAREHNVSIPVLSNYDGQWSSSDLIDGMPKNPIIDESISLYEEELDLSV